MHAYVEKARESEKDDTQSDKDLEINVKCKPLGSGLHALMTATKILQYSMTIFGIYHKPFSQTFGKTSNSRISSKLLLCYNVFVLVLLWANVLRGISSFFIGDTKGDLVVVRIITVIWYIMCSSNATIMVKSSHPRTGNQFKICDHFTNHVFHKINELDIITNNSKLRRKVIMWLIVGWLCVVTNCITGAVIVFFPNLSDDNLYILFSAPFPNTTVVRVLVAIFQIFNTVAWVLPVLYVMIRSTMFNQSFQLCKLALEKLVNKSEVSQFSAFSRDFCQIRRLHLDICKGVEVMDKDISVLFANWLLTNIPNVCLVLFYIIKTENSAFMIAVYIFWGIASVVAMVVSSGVAASLNQAAHSPLEHIYYMGTTGLTLDQMAQLQLFLSKLTGSSIGFSVLGFIVITKEMLLTIGGLFLTYFFILIQF